MPVIHSKAYALRDRTTPKSLKILMWCEHCNGDGQIETDNNGPIVDCPVCDGEGVERNTNHLPPAPEVK